ncbi:MAG: hypothetical protein JSW53_05900 [Candidatus Bathyarchaeota archaeon]|nr:MAG: hypothetical protein JSW53_05900 [Candidatus Bathyarchaeota archaeon]
MPTEEKTPFDRRYIYIVLFVLISIPLLYPLNLPIPISPMSQDVWDATVALSPGDIVVHSFDFGPSTLPENEPQCSSHLFHCRELGLRVVAVAFWAAGGPLAHDIISEIYGEGYENTAAYGTEIVYIGYIPGAEVGMQTFGDSTWDAKGTDHYGTSLPDLALMQEVRSVADVTLWAEWTSGTPGEQQVIQFIQGRHQGENTDWPLVRGEHLLPIVAGSTAVSVPGMMPFYSAGQLVGILNGLAGAGEYEKLVNDVYPQYPYEQGPGLDAQSVAHILVILFVVIGNITWAISKSGGGKSS